MKKVLLLSFFVSFLNIAIAQQKIVLITSHNYDQLKIAGKLQSDVNYKIIDSPENKANFSGINLDDPNKNNYLAKTPSVANTGTCQCMMPVDPTFTVVPFSGGVAPNYRNDDGSSPSIPLGFNFCFYGTTYTSCFINTNGNITFGSAYSAFSSTGFPTTVAVMVAPFWADVDIRNAASGLVYYKKTPTALIVKWPNVGYFNSMADKVNDFQLIITNGSDPMLPNGNNVAFCYGDMQWTTGSASGGTGGFGGTPATVGVNKGSGNNFIQIGRFDKVGNAYDGPYGSNDGISFLDNKSYFFNTCGSNNNLPPIVQDATGGGSACGDTVSICALGDTLVYTTSFLAPESGQTITVNASAPTLGSSFVPLSTTTNTAGVTTFAWMAIASPTVVGVHTVIITGTDNGNPPLSSSATYFIKVRNVSVPQPSLVVSPGSGTVCAFPGATLTLSNFSSYDNVYWSNGSSGSSMIVNTPGVHYVTVDKLGCYKSSADTVAVWPNPFPIISGALNYCPPSTSATLSVDPPLFGNAAYTSYTWSPGAINTPTAALTAGTRTLTVTNANGCTGRTVFTITTNPLTVSVTATPPAICGTGTINLSASVSGANYTWTPGGATTQTIDVTTGGSYTLEVEANSCSASAVRIVSISPTPTVTLPNEVGICANVSTTTLTALSIQPTGVYSYTWSTGENGSIITVGSNSVITVQVTDVNTQCVSLISNTCSIIATPMPTVSFAQDPINYCNGTLATLSPSVTGGTPNFTYEWSPASLGTDSIATTNASVGSFSVLVTDIFSCSASATVSVVKSSPGISITTPDDMLCPAECTVLNANGLSSFTPGTYVWSGSSVTTSSLSACAAGTYSATFTDNIGCSVSGTIIINDDVIPIASFTATPSSPVAPNQPINFGSTSTITPGTIVSETWSFGDGGTASGTNVTYAYPNAGTFPVILTVTGSNGCVDTTMINVEVTAVLGIPNVMTPNNDNANEFLKFENLSVLGDNTLFIYNRWGKKIFEQSNYKNDWNGGGHPDGTYFFILEVPKAEPKTYSGHFQIIR